MAADIKIKYPAASSVALTITLASLATSIDKSAGREGTAVDNVTATLDLGHSVSGNIRVGTSPTAGKTIEVWAFGPLKTASGVPTWPDVMTGTDAARTITSLNVKSSGWLRPIAYITVDATNNRDYPFGPVAIPELLGAMPKFWNVFVAHDTGVSLNAAGSFIEYERYQAQTV